MERLLPRTSPASLARSWRDPRATAGALSWDLQVPWSVCSSAGHPCSVTVCLSFPSSKMELILSFLVKHSGPY